MIIATDITNWMSWWVDEVVYILTACFTMLDNIQFAGTSVLKVIIGVMLLSAFLPVILTLLRGSGEAIQVGSERIRSKEKMIRVKNARYGIKYFDQWYNNDSKLSQNAWNNITAQEFARRR